MVERESGQAQIRLGLPTPSGEKQQVHDFAVRVFRVDSRAQRCEDERDLEGPPAAPPRGRVEGVIVGRRNRELEAFSARVPLGLPERAALANLLFEYGLVRQLKSPFHRGIGDKPVEACPHPGRHLFAEIKVPEGSVPVATAESVRLDPLLVDPLLVGCHQSL